MPQLRGLIFDLDGTLVDSAPDLRQALNGLLKELGRRELTLDEVKRMTGDGMMPMMTRALEATGGLPPNFNSYAHFQIFINYYRNLKADPSQIYPHVQETIETYYGKGVKLGVCTNKQEAATARILTELGLNRFFSFIAGGDTFPVHKPHPDHVKGVIAKLEVPTENCVMIGDGPNDVSAAHGAGIPCLVVTQGYGGDYGQLGADRLIGSFKELPEALSALGFQLV